MVFLTIIIIMVIAATIFNFFIQKPLIIWGISIGISLLLGIIVYPLMILWIKKLSYSIGNSKITIFQGIISKTEQNISFGKITDFQLHRSLYDRILGIATIRIQTAGQSVNNSSGYEGMLIGLDNWIEIYAQLGGMINSEIDNDEKPQNVETMMLEELVKIRKLLEKK